MIPFSAELQLRETISDNFQWMARRTSSKIFLSITRSAWPGGWSQLAAGRVGSFLPSLLLLPPEGSGAINCARTKGQGSSTTGPGILAPRWEARVVGQAQAQDMEHKGRPAAAPPQHRRCRYLALAFHVLHQTIGRTDADFLITVISITPSTAKLLLAQY